MPGQARIIAEEGTPYEMIASEREQRLGRKNFTREMRSTNAYSTVRHSSTAFNVDPLSPTLLAARNYFVSVLETNTLAPVVCTLFAKDSHRLQDGDFLLLGPVLQGNSGQGCRHICL